jgi:hypothetical protein
MSPVKYELGIYIPEDGSLHSHSRKDLTSYKALRSSFKELHLERE